MAIKDCGTQTVTRFISNTDNSGWKISERGMRGENKWHHGTIRMLKGEKVWVGSRQQGVALVHNEFGWRVKIWRSSGRLRKANLALTSGNHVEKGRECFREENEGGLCRGNNSDSGQATLKILKNIEGQWLSATEKMPWKYLFRVWMEGRLDLHSHLVTSG